MTNIGKFGFTLHPYVGNKLKKDGTLGHKFMSVDLNYKSYFDGFDVGDFKELKEMLRYDDPDITVRSVALAMVLKDIPNDSIDYIAIIERAGGYTILFEDDHIEVEIDAEAFEEAYYNDDLVSWE